METLFDAYIAFPATTSEYYMGTFDRLYKLLQCVEAVERCFDIEFSCGDNKYLSDIEDDMEELEKYDGKVCLDFPPRCASEGKEFELNKEYNFTIKLSPARKMQYFYINNKERSRRNYE